MKKIKVFIKRKTNKERKKEMRKKIKFVRK